jgi:hypothetical protein
MITLLFTTMLAAPPSPPGLPSPPCPTDSGGRGF